MILSIWRRFSWRLLGNTDGTEPLVHSHMQFDTSLLASELANLKSRFVLDTSSLKTRPNFNKAL